MSLTVVGSIAFDSVRTPFGERERMLGGSAVHFALAASFFCDVHVVGPVGDDFSDEHTELLRSRGIDTSDIERVEGGSTFFWQGHYEHDLNVAHTDDTQLGVFADFEPKLSEASRSASTLFLGNIQPDLQQEVRSQCAAARFAALDSMNLWIETARNSAGRGDLEGGLRAPERRRDQDAHRGAEPREGREGADGDGARASSSPSAASTARRCSTPTASSLCPACRSRWSGTRRAPATASRAAFLGYLDGIDDHASAEDFRKAMAYGTVLASFNVEEFGTERVSGLERDAGRGASRRAAIDDLPERIGISPTPLRSTTLAEDTLTRH